jgi:hypothetical protein
MNTVNGERINVIWFKTIKDYLECFEHHYLLGVLFDSIMEIFKASNLSWSINHMLCAKAIE